MSSLVRTARRRVQHEHGELVAAIDDCADAVAEAWDDDSASDRRMVVAPMRAALEREEVLQGLAAALEDAVEATGHDLPARPVSGPPYVVVTSRGPVCRATLESGRLVVRFDAFAVERDPDPTYHRRDGVELVVSLE